MLSGQGFPVCASIYSFNITSLVMDERLMSMISSTDLVLYVLPKWLRMPEKACVPFFEIS